MRWKILVEYYFMKIIVKISTAVHIQVETHSFRVALEGIVEDRGPEDRDCIESENRLSDDWGEDRRTET